jgi:hypothetical protein
MKMKASYGSNNRVSGVERMRQYDLVAICHWIDDVFRLPDPSTQYIRVQGWPPGGVARR